MATSNVRKPPSAQDKLAKDWCEEFSDSDDAQPCDTATVSTTATKTSTFSSTRTTSMTTKLLSSHKDLLGG